MNGEGKKGNTQNKFGETELIEVKLQSFSGFKCMIFISKVEIKYGVFPRII